MIVVDFLRNRCPQTIGSDIRRTMIRMVQSRSAAQAKDYFNDSLTKSDYYLQGQEVNGFAFHGKLAKRIGVENLATKEAFYQLCENIHPITGEKLTQRTVANRTTGYDISFSVPKSVSILHVLTNDDHILNAFTESVHSVMQHIEADAQTRVRKNGMDEDRPTGELLYAPFVHQSARPVAGMAPDPQLHCHVYTFNATWDETEQEYKAGQFRDIKASMPYYQALYFKELSDRLMALGYTIRPTAKSFEIDGVPQEAIDLFSKRTDEITAIAKRENITDTEKLSALGSRTRARKQKGVGMAALKKEWRRQLKACGLNGDRHNATLRHKKPIQASLMTAKGCVSRALLHHFERASVAQDRRILATAYLAGIGANMPAQAISESFNIDQRIIRTTEGGKTLCTTREVLAEERRMIDLATDKIGKVQPLYQSLPVLALSGEHAKAAALVLKTESPVVIIEGRAGTGKTTMMKETVRLIEQAGVQVMVVAPTSQAARDVLRNEGFPQAETVAALLAEPMIQKRFKGQALWVDEAGLLGTKDMTALLALAAECGARVILSGDTRQHTSVPRGDALRVLRDVAKIPAAEIKTIYRQKNEQYRQAVTDLSDGRIKAGFEKLDSLQAIVEVDPVKPYEQLVSDYLSALDKGKSALVISPKHKQGIEITKAVRHQLRAQGKIDTEETVIKRLVNLNLTEAEKANHAHYTKGQVLQFSAGRVGIQRGSRWTVASVNNNCLQVQNDKGRMVNVPLDQANDFDVFETQAMPVSKGDLIRITRNQYDENKKRLNNGHALEVLAVGNNYLMLTNKETKVQYKIPKDFGHLTHNYCITSHASQGKTVDEVFIAHPSDSFSATNTKQFYVSVSRGREKVKIYTDDKLNLLEHAKKSNKRISSVELVMLTNGAEIVDKVNIINKKKLTETTFNFQNNF